MTPHNLVNAQYLGLCFHLVTVALMESVFKATHHSVIQCEYVYVNLSPLTLYTADQTKYLIFSNPTRNPRRGSVGWCL